MTKHHTATQSTRPLMVTDKKTGTKIPHATQTETIRSGYCEEHRLPLRAFLGVNEKGWIFRCPGKALRMDDGTTMPALSHLVLNTPPPEEVEAQRQRRSMTTPPSPRKTRQPKPATGKRTTARSTSK